MAGDRVVKVPADDLCLYYIPLVHKDVEEWQRDRDQHGHVRNQERAAKDKQCALQVRQAIIDLAEAGGDAVTAQRLKLPGHEGWPSQDELPYLAAHMGAQVLLVIPRQDEPDLVVKYGQGSDKVSIIHTIVEDGAGHPSPHWNYLKPEIKSEPPKSTFRQVRKTHLKEVIGGLQTKVMGQGRIIGKLLQDSREKTNQIHALQERVVMLEKRSGLKPKPAKHPQNSFTIWAAEYRMTYVGRSHGAE